MTRTTQLQADVPKRFYRVREICHATGLSKGKVFQALTEGRLTGIKLGGVLLIPTESLERYLGEAVPWTPEPKLNEHDTGVVSVRSSISDSERRDSS